MVAYVVVKPGKVEYIVDVDATQGDIGETGEEQVLMMLVSMLVMIEVEGTHSLVGPTGLQEGHEPCTVVVNGIEMVWSGPQGVCEGHEPDSIEVIVNGGEVGHTGAEGQLPEMVLITVDGVHSLAGPTGVAEQDVSMLVIVAATQLVHEDPTLMVLVSHEVVGVHDPVPIGPIGDVGEQVSTVEKLVTGTHSLWDGHDPTAVIVIGGSVKGEQVPTPPTGELDAQLGASVTVKASQVPLPQVEELPDPYPQEVSDAEADRGTTGLAAARMLKDVSNTMRDRE